MATDPHREPVCAFLKKLVLRYWGKAASLATAIEVDASTVSRWLSGDRVIGADDLHKVVAATLADHPEDAAVIGRWMVDALVGDGRLQIISAVPDPTPRAYLREVRDAREVQNQFDAAVDAGDVEAVDEAWDRGRLELDQQRAAAHQEIARRRVGVR